MGAITHNEDPAITAPFVAVIRTEDGCRTALICRVGRTKVHAVWIESSSAGVRAASFPKESLSVRTIEYPVRKCVRALRDAGRNLGISKGARALLTGALGS